jgi:hypothetical protein
MTYFNTMHKPTLRYASHQRYSRAYDFWVKDFDRAVLNLGLQKYDAKYNT